MFDALAYQYRLHRLQRTKRRLRRTFRQELALAKREGASGDALEAMVSEQRLEMDLIGDDISQLVTDRLHALADAYLIPVPPLVIIYPGGAPDADAKDPPDWELSHVSNRYYLSAAAAADLRAAIRKEQREGSELIFRWLSGLTGVVGALIGLTALLTRHR